MEAREVKKVKEAMGLLESLVSQDEEGVSAKKGEVGKDDLNVSCDMPLSLFVKGCKGAYPFFVLTA